MIFMSAGAISYFPVAPRDKPASRSCLEMRLGQQHSLTARAGVQMPPEWVHWEWWAQVAKCQWLSPA